MPSPVLALMGMMVAFGFRMRMFAHALHAERVEHGQRVDLVDEHHVADADMSGYLSGLSSPTGQQDIAFAEAPVSNSAGHTRLPTFSKIARSTGARPLRRRSPHSPKLVQALLGHARVEVAHAPRVQLDGAPVPRMVRVSTSESISASITAMDISSRSASIVRVSVVVLPEPGLDSIEQECPALAQRPAQLLRLAIVIGEYALFDLNNANISHEPSQIWHLLFFFFFFFVRLAFPVI